ncbi:MAG TPA: ribose-phosphate diphosphokinase [Steroidobacteraceae bacterium]
MKSHDQGASPSSGPRFFALSESVDLAARVAEAAQLPLSSLEERRFEGGEFKFRPLESVRGRTVVVLQSLAGTETLPVGERLTRLLFFLLGLRDAGADRRVVVLPYLTFAREDRRTQLRDPVTSRYVAELLEAAGASQLITLDVHNPAALDNAFRIPVDHLSAVPMLVEHFARQFASEPLTVVSPDIGGIKRVQLFREQLVARLRRPVGIAFIEKRRQDAVLSGGTLVGDVTGQTVLILDDLCATGETLVRAAKACHSAGAAAIHVAVTHTPVPAGINSVEALDSISGLVVTDSTGLNTPSPGAPPNGLGKRTVLPIAPLLGEATRRLLANKPLAPLLERWPISAEE